MKIAEPPASRVDTPVSATANAAEFELSSNFQPVMSMGDAPVLVSSNQSAAYDVFPLAHGVPSDTITAPAALAGAAGRNVAIGTTTAAAANAAHARRESPNLFIVTPPLRAR